MRYVVLAELRARPERVAELDAFMARHAAASREEPGCLVFDVCREPGNAAAFVLDNNVLFNSGIIESQTTMIRLLKDTAAAWTASTDLTYVRAQLFCEVV